MKILIYIATYILIGIILNVLFSLISRIWDNAHPRENVGMEDTMRDLTEEASVGFSAIQDEKGIPVNLLYALSLILWPITIPVGAVAIIQTYRESRRK